MRKDANKLCPHNCGKQPSSQGLRENCQKQTHNFSGFAGFEICGVAVSAERSQRSACVCTKCVCAPHSALAAETRFIEAVSTLKPSQSSCSHLTNELLRPTFGSFLGMIF
ncbi:uncharacterized protein VK521_009519 [Ammospiza maritima maritima]